MEFPEGAVCLHLTDVGVCLVILYTSIFLITFAGLPPTTTLSGTSFVTTLPAATTAFLPMVTPGQMMAPMHSHGQTHTKPSRHVCHEPLCYSLIVMTSDMSQFFRISTIRSSSKAMQPPSTVSRALPALPCTSYTSSNCPFFEAGSSSFEHAVNILAPQTSLYDISSFYL